MTVASETNKSGPYAGAGTTGPFTVGFRFLDETHLRVIKTSTTGIDSDLTLTTDYTVAGVGNDTGSVTLVTALASGEKLTIVRDVPFVQQTDYLNNDAFPAESHENALDLLTMQTQQLKERVDAALTLPSTTSGVSTQLPTPEANKLIGWDSVASGLQNYDTQTLATIVAFGTANADLFDGDGSTTQFTLSDNPGALNNLDVSIGGVTQTPGLDYTWTSGTTITFTSAPPVGTDNVLVRYMQALPQGSGEAGSIEYTPAGSGAVATNVQSKLREFVSVKDFGAVGDGAANDTTAVQAAVTHCFTTGDQLYWPDGTYLTTASISNLHSVKHFGAGAIQRGSDVFYVDPKGSQSNTVYLSTTGNNTNDGLSSSQPRLTFQGAFDAVANYGKPVLDGVWNIVAAAGTYTISAGQQTFSTPSKNRVVIRGPVAGHPNVPTCIVDGGGNGAAYAHGLSASGPGVSVEFRDIKFQNLTEASGNTRIGLVGQNRSDFLTTNIHSSSCSWAGIYATVTDRARISGGILDGSGSGAYGVIIDTTEATLGYLGALASNRPVIKNTLSAGVYWSTGSQGHADYCDIEDCGVGFLIAENSRCDTVNLNFKRNTVAIRARTGGVWGEGGVPNVYNQGTADANGTVFQALALSGNITELDNVQSGTSVRVAYDRTTRSASGAAAYSFPTVYTLGAYRLQGAGKTLRVHVKGVYTVTASSTVVVNIGGMAVSFTVPAAATNAAFEVDLELMDVAGGYRAIGRLSAGLNATRFATATAGFDNTVANAISVSGNLTGAGDSINIYRTDIYLMG